MEATVAQLFPKAVVRRMDADSMTRKDAYRETLRAFRAGKIDILVGTQMIAKGLHFPNVTLVGIINADLALHMPDFRAGERTFQLLTQVAGRAGRGESRAKFSCKPSPPSVLRFSSRGITISPAISSRRWSSASNAISRPSSTPSCSQSVPHTKRAPVSPPKTLARRLSEALPAEFIRSAPTPAPLEKLQGQFRFHILLRGEAIVRLSRLVRETLDKLPFPEDVLVSVDVDPYQLL